MNIILIGVHEPQKMFDVLPHSIAKPAETIYAIETFSDLRPFDSSLSCTSKQLYPTSYANTQSEKK